MSAARPVSNDHLAGQPGLFRVVSTEDPGIPPGGRHRYRSGLSFRLRFVPGPSTTNLHGPDRGHPPLQSKLSLLFRFLREISRGRPGNKKIRFRYERIRDTGGPCHIQLSGGEPTVRDDLSEIIALGRRLGFDFIQLNTNGLRLAREADYARSLRESGLASVFLQFDGTSPESHRALRGLPLEREKQQAIERCGQAGLGVVLVPTVVPGINDRELGAILQFGLERSPVVRGVHFQPVSYFGRYPVQPDDALRITIPEILAALEVQSSGRVRTKDFKPSGCEHALCSFHGNFLVLSGNRLQGFGGGCPGGLLRSAHPWRGVPNRTMVAVTRQWSAPPAAGAGFPDGGPLDLSGFLDQVRRHGFSISGMAFQDVWNLDLDRLRGCCIHTLAPDGRLIPFCAYNLTDVQGVPLYRARDDPADPVRGLDRRKVSGPGKPSPLTRAALSRYQLEKFQGLIDYSRVRSPFYRRHLAGLSGKSIQKWDDLASTPFTTPDDLQTDSLQFLCVSQSAIERVVTLPVFAPAATPRRLFFTREELEQTVDFFHHGMSTLVGPGDRVLILLPGEKPDSVGGSAAAGPPAPGCSVPGSWTRGRSGPNGRGSS